MAVTFITVHGTGDHLEDASDRKWWEPNSDFSRRLLSEAGGGKVVAFKWSGANDEIARREAAEDLLWKLRDFDERGEEVVLVGHSHGGSVINTALKLSMSMQRSFSNIKSVITVGTPFIRMKPQRFLWERLNFAGQLAFLYSVSLFLLLISAIATIFIYQASTGEMTEMTQAVNEMKQTSEYADNGPYTDNVREMETTVEEATQEVTVAWATVASPLPWAPNAGHTSATGASRSRRPRAAATTAVSPTAALVTEYRNTGLSTVIGLVPIAADGPPASDTTGRPSPSTTWSARGCSRAAASNASSTSVMVVTTAPCGRAGQPSSCGM